MKKFALLLVTLIAFLSCSKDDSSNTPRANQYHQNPEVSENVIAILDGNANLLSSEADLSNGIYTIEFNNGVPEMEANDIILGDEGEGFLRKVTSVSVNGNILTMQTVQANMEEVFKEATIEFTTDISENSKMTNGKSQELKVNYLAKGVVLSNNGLDYDFSETTLYDENGLTFEIIHGTAKFDPNFSFKADYSLFSGLEYLNFNTNNATLNIDCNLSLDVSGNVSLPEFSKTLADFDKRLTFLVAGLPVIVIVNTQLVAKLNAGIDANVTVTSGFTNNYTLTSGVKLENDSWTGNFDLNSSLTPKPVNFCGNVNITQNLTITPKVSMKFYGIVGPFSEPKMTEDFAFNVASPSLDWDSSLKVGLDITTGINVTIFGKSVNPWSRKDSFEETIWTADSSDSAGENGCVFTDSRDGQTYTTVKIGTQTWFAENLNFQTDNSWCYDNDPSNCDIYGRLYHWQAAMNACPEGWHLPTAAEWTTLQNFLGGKDIAGGKMKEAGFEHWISPNTGATNSSGFTGLPSGFRSSGIGNPFYLLNQWHGAWTATSPDSLPDWVYHTDLNSAGTEFFVEGTTGKTSALPCRCIKD